MGILILYHDVREPPAGEDMQRMDSGLASHYDESEDAQVEEQNIQKELQWNIDVMRNLLPVQESFDLIQRDMIIGGRNASYYFVDGFTKDEAMLKIMDSLYGVKSEAMPEDAEAFIQEAVPYVEVDLLQDFDQVVKNTLSGVTCLFIDGYEKCIAIDCRTYPARSVEEPEKDKSLRGSRDGFVETIVFNTALIRRRIRDPHLVMEMMEVGSVSRTDITLCYLTDRVDPKLLASIRTCISRLRLDALKMNQQTLAESMLKRKWWNPFPKYKYTERPDTTAACLLEGKLVILVDNSPSALILPTSIFDMIEEANDYYFPSITGTYLKVSRILITILTVFLTPLMLLYMQNPGWLPRMFAFVSIHDAVNIPPVFQFLILELSIDGLRLAALNTPNMLTTPLSVIAGIVLGDYAVESGWFNSEIMLYMAFVAVANYTQPNFELGYALKFMRLLVLVLTGIFNLPGFLAGVVLVLCFVGLNKTLSGKNYLHVSLK